MSQPLLGVDAALKILIKAAPANNSTSRIPINKALNQVLAQNVCADIDVPGFDNSAVDGYAIALKAEQINTSSKLVFAIMDKIPAGAIGKPLNAGSCAQIFTGAPIPKGANTVIMQEECHQKNGSISVDCPISKNKNIRPLGDDIKKGDIILSAGKQLKPEDIALAASIGLTELTVFTKLKVGIFFTGDELVEPGKTLNPGQIFSSNQFALTALLENTNCKIVNLKTIKDDFAATCAALQTLATKCDLIITTGGVSVGEKDHVKQAVEKLGKLSLWKIKMKPGKPFAFGTIDNTPFMGLPGNPVSAIVTFLLLARPFIKKMQGITKFNNPTFLVQANFNLMRAKLRTEFARVQLDYSAIPPLANLYPKQNSNILSSLVWADGLAEIPEQTTFAQGQILNFYPLNI